MDPNEALRKIHQAITDFNEPDTDAEEYLSAVDELINNFEALDEWLKGGGFLPDDWAIIGGCPCGEADLGAPGHEDH